MVKVKSKPANDRALGLGLGTGTHAIQLYQWAIRVILFKERSFILSDDILRLYCVANIQFGRNLYLFILIQTFG